jgi:hypothetical protein
MGFSGVSFMVVKTVLGIELVQVDKQVIAVGFSQDGGGGDGEAFLVPLNHPYMGKIPII